MHTWWTGSWEGPTPVLPSGRHQRNLQMRRQRRQMQKAHRLDWIREDDDEPGDTDKPDPSDTAVLDEQRQHTEESGILSSSQQALTTSPILPNGNQGTQSSWRSKPKRRWSNEDSEAKADQAATEIVELVEQEMSGPQPHERVTKQSSEVSTPQETDVSDIPEHILAESREMSKEVTPPVHLFFRDEGERQDGDCGLAEVIGV